ncbi:MAG: CPBP family intramembrane metalloprotease [Anaerolineales bacterium]|nr:CPBP family intramembrane metalloprotease [Anaerolineales bacterium]
MKQRQGLILLLLLLLRIFPFSYIFQGQEAILTTVLKIYQVATFFLVALLIGWEKENLADFHIDRLSLMIILLSRTVLIWFGGSAILLDCFIYPLSLLIAINLFVRLGIGFAQSPIKAANIAWVFIGIIGGIVFFAAQSLILALLANVEVGMLPNLVLPNSVGELVVGFVRSLSNEGIDEEPLFRGFLWGYLRRFGLKDHSIWWIQGVLFWLVHYDRLFMGHASFWFGLPFGLLFGFLAWRSRSLSSSMAAHAIYNASATLQRL